MEEEITLDDFRKLRMATARVLQCEKIPKSKRLLRLVVQIGAEQRQIVSSIADHYDPASLVGKTIIVLTNLKKTTFMGFESQGMLLAVEDGDFLSLLTTDRDAPSGLMVT
ncbi:methionine--tRNA ligase subunit beta [Thermoplasmatales archaeon AK]|nr:methionine--tRNA ligase subunit beta [Thermoplasmatales archaeon AK]